MSLLTRVWSFACLKYWACSRCLVSFNLVPFYWRGGRGPGVMGLVLSRSREGRRREIVGTRLSSLAVLCLLKVPSIFQKPRSSRIAVINQTIVSDQTLAMACQSRAIITTWITYMNDILYCRLNFSKQHLGTLGKQTTFNESTAMSCLNISYFYSMVTIRNRCSVEQMSLSPTKFCPRIASLFSVS